MGLFQCINELIYQFAVVGAAAPQQQGRGFDSSSLIDPVKDVSGGKMFMFFLGFCVTDT